jgi:2-keto-4-pentenoate hydratase/2-oxohepta-3-ene-1,7-dioic acid hydratase in catechol pathway
MKPPQFLKPRDKVWVEIDRIGAIEAVMRPETAQPCHLSKKQNS